VEQQVAVKVAVNGRDHALNWQFYYDVEYETLEKIVRGWCG